MIDMSDVVADTDIEAPKPFIIFRSVGQWTQDGFQSSTSQIMQVGPVQRATALDVQMLQEADRVEGVMAFWCLVPVYVTRANQDETAVQGVVPQGVYPGFVYTVDPDSLDGSPFTLYKNGLFQIPGIDYTYADGAINMLYETTATDRLYVTWYSTKAGAAASDIIQYERYQYRVLSVKHYPGSGYWRALGTRMSPV